MCVAQARGELDTEREEHLHPLLRWLANLPPEVVREHVVPHTR